MRYRLVRIIQTYNPELRKWEFEAVPLDRKNAKIIKNELRAQGFKARSKWVLLRVPA